MRVIFATAAILALMYALLLSLIKEPEKVRALSQVEENQKIAEKYARLMDAPNVVLVGSSMTHRLPIPVGQGCMHNLALNGESALTGLSLIEQSGVLPRHILIESNVLTRPLNADIVSHALLAAKPYGFFSRTENRPLNVLLTLGRGISADSGRDTEVDSETLKRMIQIQSHKLASTMQSGDMSRGVEKLRELVQRLEHKGAEVAFFQMPVDEALSSLPGYTTPQRLIKSSFPRHAFYDAATLTDGAPVKTTDGIHLASSSAAFVAQRLSALTKPFCTSSM